MQRQRALWMAMAMDQANSVGEMRRLAAKHSEAETALFAENSAAESVQAEENEPVAAL